MADNTQEFTPFPHFATKTIHVGSEPEQWKSHGVVPQISLATTFKQEAPGQLIAVSQNCQIYLAMPMAIEVVDNLFFLLVIYLM